MQGKILLFAIVAGVLSGLNLFFHKVAADKLDETSLSQVLSPSFLFSLARNPYVYLVLLMGLVVLAVDLAFLSNDVPAVLGLNLVIVLGNVLFAVLCVVLLGEEVDLRIAAGIGCGILALILLSRV